MYRNMTRRKLTTGAAAIAVLAGSGIAAAYWTGSGSGSGSGTADGGASVTLTGSVAAGLAPGLTKAVTFTAANASTAAVMTGTVHLDGVTVDAGHAACDTGDFSMADVVQNHSVPAGSTAESLPNDGALVFTETSMNQDACKGATLTLALSSS
ncbi:MAG: hypothetical protein JWM50_1844 [Microbacteriaceae bacterium]|nr:hypothetical protein [Microbacteriaceae bacterium]